MNHCSKGKMAEELAARYLRARGYRIWKSNWRWGRKEIDLIALYRNELVIVEVKARDGNAVNDPAEVVDARKQRHIILATEGFIRVHDCHYPTRFDIISVIFRKSGTQIEHIPDAFRPC